MVDTIETTTMTDEERAALQWAVGGVATLTSGASPVTLNINAFVTEITTGGTEGDEIVLLPNFAFTVDDYVTPEKTGTRIVVYVKTQTSESDTVKVRREDEEGFRVLDRRGIVLQTASELVLDYLGAHVGFEWDGYEWVVSDTAGNTDTNYVNEVVYAPPMPTDGSIQLLTNFGGSQPSWQGDMGVCATGQSLYTGASPINLGYFFHQTYVYTGGTGTEELVLPPSFPYANIGARFIVYAAVVSGEDVISMTGPLQDADGVPLSAVTMNAVGQYALFEAWDLNTIRYLRGTATPVLV